MDTLVSRLLELSASLGAEGTQPSGSSEEEGGDTSFALLPSELLGPLLASLPLQALGSLALACKSTRMLVAQHLSSLRELRHERELKGWSNRRVLSLLRAATGLHSLSLDAAGDVGASLLSQALSQPAARRLASLRISGAGAPRSGCDVPLVDAVQEVLFDFPAELAQLSSLALNSCPALNDALAERLGSLPRLTSLSLAENTQLSQEIARAARALPDHLRRLHHPPTSLR